MKRRKRQDGIRTMRGLKDRCRVNAETGCWEWAGARRKGQAMVWMPGTGAVSMARAMALLMGEPPAGKRWIPRCNDACCGNPSHRTIGTPSEFMRALRPTLAPTHRAAITTSIRAQRSAYTPELAEAVRQSLGTCRDAAADFGLHPSTVSKIRRGQAWVDVSGSSVFAWRPA